MQRLHPDGSPEHLSFRFPVRDITLAEFLEKCVIHNINLLHSSHAACRLTGCEAAVETSWNIESPVDAGCGCRH